MERDSKWLCHILTTTLVLKKFLFFLFFFSFLRKILTRRETYSHMYALNVLKKKNVSLSTLSFTTSNLETNFVGNFRKRVRRREARWGDLPRYVRRVDASTG